MKVLITGGRSAQALKLVKAFPNDTVLLADYGDVPRFSSANYQMISLGDRNDDTIAHQLLNTCLDHGADLVLPLHIFEIEALSKAAVLFEEFNISALLPQMSQLPEYLKPGSVAGDWAVYHNGKLLFTPQPDAQKEELGKTAQLNGAFYITPGDPKPVASLFTLPS